MNENIVYTESILLYFLPQIIVTLREYFYNFSYLM